MGEFRMPSLGADMESGTLVEWHVAVGDHVDRGDTIAVVDTDKAMIDVEVFESGVVTQLLVEPGAVVPVGEPLALIGEAGSGAEPLTSQDAAPAAPKEAPPAAPAPAAPAPAAPAERPASSPETPVVGGPGRHHASLVLSPVVRHLAERLGVQPARLTGSGPGGRVTRDDVESAAAGRVSPRARRLAAERGVDVEVLRGRGTGPGGAVVARDLAEVGATSHAAEGPGAADGRARAGPLAAMARMMERSNREIPHFHVASTVDLEPAMAWLDDRNAGRRSAERILPAALFVRAVAFAARAVPSMNGWWRDGGPVLAPSVTVGMVVSLRGGGLITPSLADPDRCTVDELMDGLKEAVGRARHGSLRSSDTQAASITVTNLGDRGAEVVHGVIEPPQLALVGFGRVVERPWISGGEVVPRRVVTVSAAVDHRANDGHSASRFLARVEELLAAPESMAAPESTAVRQGPATQPQDPGGRDGT